jgi:REP element-mobilizing transposase RayT
MLTQQIANAEQGCGPLPEVSHSMFTDSIPNIIGSWLARGVRRYQIKLYGFVWMSNHAHLLVQAPLGNLADFMAYLNGQIAREINRFLGRRHQLWARRYALGQVLDEPAEIERLVYILTNPQKARIADTIEQWLGLSSAPFLLEGKHQQFLCFDRTRWYWDGRPDDIAPYLSTVELEHDVLPQLETRDIKERQALIRQLIREQETALHRADDHVDRDGRREQARRRTDVEMTVPTDRPAHPKRSPQPLCHTTKPALYKVFRRWFRLFVSLCRERSREYMRGNIAAVFAPGAFAPSKFPSARYPEDPEKAGLPHLTRKKLGIAVAQGDGLVLAAA